MGIRMQKTPQARRVFLEKQLAIDLPHIAKALIDDEDSIHCENLIGAVAVPLGVAGPLYIQGEDADSQVYVPLATTEGALVASVSRGAKTITQAGGATVRAEYVGVTRGPVFKVRNIQHGKICMNWIHNHTQELANEAKATSDHLKLLHIQPSLNGRQLYLRISYDCDQAMGMNMATIATDAIATSIQKHTKAILLAVAGNYDTDKKPSWLNIIHGRGYRLLADVVISAEILQSQLHVTPKQLTETVIQKCWGGSMMSGSMGYNAHFANIIAAFFIATGQDAAHISEGSIGITSAEVLADGSLYFAIQAPDILLGTVGGGTKLKTQTQARSITKTKTAKELAEILAGALLAGELSLLASLTENTLSVAHKRLGR